MTSPTAPAVTVLPAFVLLFAATPAAAAAKSGPPTGVQPIPEQVVVAYRERIEDRQQHVLRQPCLQARRLGRRTIGRLALPGGDTEPAFADIHRVLHKSGAAVWEVWLTAPAQPLAVERWIAWLDMDAPDSLARRVWDRLAPAAAGATAPPEAQRGDRRACAGRHGARQRRCAVAAQHAAAAGDARTAVPGARGCMGLPLNL